MWWLLPEWNKQRRRSNRLHLLDDVDLQGENSNLKTASVRKAVLNGTGTFDICSPTQFSHHLMHALPVVELTNELCCFHYFRCASQCALMQSAFFSLSARIHGMIVY